MGALKRPGGVCRLGPRGEFLDTTGMSHPLEGRGMLVVSHTWARSGFLGGVGPAGQSLHNPRV